MKIYEDLLWRGLIKDITDDELIDKLNNSSLTFYIGTDPTADSMHIGHYSSFLISRRLAKAGHKAILLIGSGTGLIGDPKPTAERPIISYDELMKNSEALTKQATEIFGFKVVNNYDWLKNINMIDYLRDFGKYFNVNYMLSKDIVSRRLDTGITYTEFSYMLLQSIDFLYLYENYNCELQVAGSDQWGNITAGVELIRKKIGKKAYGLVMPLITDTKGDKIGKTDGNALWLDKNKTSSFELYQYFYNIEDAVVIDYLKTLTFLSKEQIEEIEKLHNKSPEKRMAQIKLAEEIISDIHSANDFIKAKKQSEEIFSNKGLSPETPLIEIENNGDIDILSLLVEAGISSSKSESRRLVEQGGISINQVRETDIKRIIKEAELLEEVLIKRGKKSFYKIKYK